MKTYQGKLLSLVCLMNLLICTGQAAGESNILFVGCATIDITPSKPIALAGQFNTRISRSVENLITATAVAIETRDGDRMVDCAVLLSCDIVSFRPTVLKPLQEKLKKTLSAFDPRKVVLTATHTHTSAVTEEGMYEIPKEGVIQPLEYTEFLIDKLAEVIGKAWEKRQPGGVSWVLGHAMVGLNRRAVYADGKAIMYGSTTTNTFRGIEGGEDHGIEMLFFWDKNNKPLAVCINVECPSQEIESRSTINADFWSDVRTQIHADINNDICVLGWPGSAGDLSPHRMYRKAAEERMLKLRDLTYTQEIGRRITAAVKDVYELAKHDIRTEVLFAHKVEELNLPVRKVTKKELAEAKNQFEILSKKKDGTRKGAWNKAVIDRYETQKKEPTLPIEVHVLRIGDIAIATNPFELFHDYGVQMKSRSKALQTFVIQLTGPSCGYLATKRAIEGGGYSAVIQSNKIGHEGGQVLVEETLRMINELFQ